MRYGFRHPLVRALAWLIGSPGLIDSAPAHPGAAIVDDLWCEAALADTHAWLMREDARPAAIEAAIAARRIVRVGRLAEALIGYWLTYSGRFTLLAENLAVRDGGRTLGDFDFILRDHANGRVEHWELTVKFYLREAGASGFAGYLGPNRQDALADKTARIFTRQLGLGATPQGRAALSDLGVADCQPRAFFKGWLFYPGAADAGAVPGVNPHHCRGWWRRYDPQRPSGTEPCRYVILEPLAWLGGPHAQLPPDTLSAAQYEARLTDHFTNAGTALQVVEFCAAGSERGRGFIVPQSWGMPGRTGPQSPLNG